MADRGSLLECHTMAVLGVVHIIFVPFPAAILYAVLQANDVGLLCSVLLSLSLYHPDIPASYLHMQ